jgi:hypothetical protein
MRARWNAADRYWWICIVLAISSAGCAPGSGGGSCVWGPITDMPRAQLLLRNWAETAKLSTFDKDESSLSIDGSNGRLVLQFSPGTLTLSWRLDADCDPVEITIVASAEYAGAVPDEATVERLVASFRSVTVELRGQAALDRRPVDPRAQLAIAALLIALLTRFLLGRRRRKELLAQLRGRLAATSSSLRTMPFIGWVRLLGVAVVVALLPYQVPPLQMHMADTWPDLVSAGTLPLIVFLWLAATGTFGYGSPGRADWWALLPFLLALAIREGYARHGVEGNVLHFNVRNISDTHSIVYTFYLMFIHPLARDPFQIQMHSNGILGAMAALPLYLFIRQRTGSRAAGTLVATFYAVHPILVQMAPTDSPYSLCFATWFLGLTLLSTAEIGAKQLVGAGGLLGIAATCRPEGGLFLAASLVLLDVRPLLRAARLHLGAAALSFAVLVGLLAAEVYFIFATHMGGGGTLPVDETTIAAVLKAGLWSTDFNDPLIVILAIVGAVAGLVNRRLRVGVGALAGALIVVWPFGETTYGGYIILHRLSATCALQVIAAGIGAAWITSWLPAKLREHPAALLPGLVAALYLLVVHRQAIHEQMGLSDEFWMLRNNLAPGGVVKTECKLVWVGRSMDTDIHNFEDVVPGMEGIRCQERDCLADIAKGGCFYYMRGLNCFFSETRTKRECLQEGKTPTGGYLECIDPECVRVETSLRLELVEQRTVDVHTVWNYERRTPFDPHFPLAADVALYRVIGLKN